MVLKVYTMQENNKELVRKINESFLSGNIEMVLDYIDENIKWNIVGMPCIQGKTDFIKTMEMMDFENFPNIKIKHIIAEGDFVVIESSDANSTGTNCFQPDKPYTPSYCDIYFIKNGKIQELTTYIVDITYHNEL
jgi:ketosteroid isomerase-like protein